MTEVASYVRAANRGHAHEAELPVSVRLIREFHAGPRRGALAGKLQPGELRTSRNWIELPGCALATAAFVPAPP
ncbi:MAG: hypothetical protein AB1773_06445 [Pseudomonadota bacterium]